MAYSEIGAIIVCGLLGAYITLIQRSRLYNSMGMITFLKLNICISGGATEKTCLN